MSNYLGRMIVLLAVMGVATMQLVDGKKGIITKAILFFSASRQS